jgi:hypothetical protein
VHIPRKNVKFTFTKKIECLTSLPLAVREQI